MHKLLFIGNSHMGAFVGGAKDRSQADTSFQFLKMTDPRYARCLKRTKDGWDVVGNLADDLTTAVSDGFEIVSCVGGNAHNVFGMIQHPQPYDFTLPEAPNLPMIAGAQNVPLAHVRDALTRQIGAQIDNICALGTVAPVRHIESPPPVYSNDFVAQNANRLFQDQDLQTLGVSPAHLRYKLWALHSQIFREGLTANGIEYVLTPTEVVDDAGYLKEDFTSHDATHANARYGVAVLEQLKSAATVRTADASV